STTIDVRRCPLTIVRCEPGSSQNVLYPPTLPYGPFVPSPPTGGALRSPLTGFSAACIWPRIFASSFAASASERVAGMFAARSIGVIVPRSYVPCKSGCPSAARGIDPCPPAATRAATDAGSTKRVRSVLFISLRTSRSLRQRLLAPLTVHQLLD